MGPIALSNYIYCPLKNQRVHTTVCAVRCPRYQCSQLREYEHNACVLRKLIATTLCGKQLRLFNGVLLEEDLDGVPEVQDGSDG